MDFGGDLGSSGMDSQSYLLWCVLTSAVGAGYFIYGKKQGRVVALICGAVLCVFPYVVTNTWLLAGIGITLMVLPFVVRL